MFSSIKDAFQDPKRAFGLYGATYSIKDEDGGEDLKMTHLAGDTRVSQKLRHVAATQDFLTTPIKIEEKTVGTYLKDERGARLENLFIKTMNACDITATVMASALFKISPTCRDGIFTFGITTIAASLIRLAGLVVGAAACASIIPAIEFLAVAGVKSAEGMKFLAAKIQEFAPRAYEVLKNCCVAVGAALATAGAMALKGAKFVYDQISPYLKPFVYAVAAIILGAGILAADIVNVTLRLLLDIASSASNAFKDWLVGDIKEAFAYLANERIEDKEQEIKRVKNDRSLTYEEKVEQITALNKKILEVRTLRDKFISERKSIAEKTTDRVVNSYTVKFFSTLVSEATGYVKAVNNSFTDLAGVFKGKAASSDGFLPSSFEDPSLESPRSSSERIGSRDYVEIKDDSSTHGSEDFLFPTSPSSERSRSDGARSPASTRSLLGGARLSSEEIIRSYSSRLDSGSTSGFSGRTPSFDA
jgi:hypothetical protein